MHTILPVSAVFLIIHFILFSLHRYIPWYSDALCKIWEFCMHTILPVSAVFLVAIARDRHTLLCRPTHLPSPRAARRQLTITLVGAIAMGKSPV
jgi:hypothetical protein